MSVFIPDIKNQKSSEVCQEITAPEKTRLRKSEMKYSSSFSFSLKATLVKSLNGSQKSTLANT
jgi:predicted nucleic acid-binding Zn ribbon protein